MAVVLADWLLLWMIRDDAVGVNIGHESCKTLSEQGFFSGTYRWHAWFQLAAWWHRTMKHHKPRR